MVIRRVSMNEIRQKYTQLNIDRKWIILASLAFLLSFFINIWPIVFLAIFCIANAMLLTIDRYVEAPIDIELSTFSAVLMTSAYSLKWGILAAILTKLAAILYNKIVRVDHLLMVIGYLIAAVIASMLNTNIIITGIVSTIVVNTYNLLVSKFITMLSTYEIIMYGGSNTLFNIVLFIGFSEFILKLMF